MNTTATPVSSLGSGYVLGIVTGQCKALTREEWDAAVRKVWPAFIAEMSSNPGYKGAYATWDADHPRQVSINGIWESMEHRVAYEAKSSGTVRAVFNALIDNPQRTRLIISQLD